MLSSETGSGKERIAVDPLPGTILWKLLILGKGYYHRGNSTDPGGAVRIGLYLRVDGPDRLKTPGFFKARNTYIVRISALESWEWSKEEQGCSDIDVCCTECLCECIVSM